MAVHSVKKADDQRERTLRLEVKGEEAGRAYEAIALVPSDPSLPITVCSEGQYMPPTKEIQEAARKYVEQRRPPWQRLKKLGPLIIWLLTNVLKGLGKAIGERIWEWFFPCTSTSADFQ